MDRAGRHSLQRETTTLASRSLQPATTAQFAQFRDRLRALSSACHLHLVLFAQRELECVQPTQMF